MNYDIVTYCSSSHKAALDLCLPSWMRSDATNVIIYADFPLEIAGPKITIRYFWSPIVTRGEHCKRKAASLLDHVQRTPNRNMVLIDSDCFVCKDLGEIFEDDFKIAATYYDIGAKTRAFNNFSAGVICLKKDRNFQLSFLQEWARMQDESMRQEPCLDQKSLSMLIKKHFRSCTKLLDVDMYNCHPFSLTSPDVQAWIRKIEELDPYIVHFAHRTWNDPVLVDEVMEKIYE